MQAHAVAVEEVDGGDDLHGLTSTEAIISARPLPGGVA
jgi:hypothetical protein